MGFLQGTEKSPEVPEEDQRRVTEMLNQYENGDQGVLPTRLDDQDHAGPECGEVAVVAIESGDSGFVGGRDVAEHSR
jgi:hypothetical protein